VRVRTSARSAGIVASVAVTALAFSAVAACGSSSAAKSAGDVTVSGEFDKQPTISVPKGKPPATTDVKVISRGSGPALKSGDLAVVDGYGRTWDDATTFENTYTSDAVPDTLPVGTGQIALTGLDKALLGVPTGSRVLIVLPPKEGFGLASQLPTGVQKTDTAVLVFDVLGGYQSNAGPSGQQVSSGGGDLPTVTSAGVNQKPTVAIPKSDPPAKLSVTTLVKGDGPAVAKGQELVVQYLGQIWASGNEFDSSWKRGQPTAFTVGAGQLIQAWDDGLVGVPVGSRVLIVAPPDSAYGAAGQPSAGIAGTDTLVFVVDVLGAYSP
jgi:peptidylprolyl isomerase